MKWRTNSSSEKVRPFLVLPLLENERSVSAESQLVKKKTMPTGLLYITRNISTGTETWPPKVKQKRAKKRDMERPLTATLERPEVLNINLIDKIDMSLVRKEFLSITNLCKFPLETLVIGKSKRTSSLSHRRSIKPPPKSLTPNMGSTKRTRRPETSESSLEEEESASQRSMSKNARKISKINIVTKSIKSSKSSNDANNNDSPKTPKQRNSTGKRAGRVIESVKSIDDAFSGPKTNRSLPEPCTTCGRPDQPERFHSHPTTPLRPIKKLEVPKKIKSTVQKPVAIRYKPSVKAEDAAKKSPATPKASAPVAEEPKKSPAKGPKTMICYICGREFGTASLPIHEPKCLQKWERENALLPRHLQRKPPTKPEKMSPEEWNKFVWESTQKKSIPKTKAAHPNDMECYVCGLWIENEKLESHEAKCLTRWRVQNRKKPPPHRSPTPVKNAAPPDEAKEPPKRAVIRCFICQSEIDAGYSHAHERECLQQWELDNSAMPRALRRPRPKKMEVCVLTENGHIDFEATNELMWQSHLSQLVPCQNCGRTFNPDRVIVHERSCKG